MNRIQERKRAELLAPAGSFETMKAVIAAGADAVYMGLQKFSARAYANNAAAEDYSAAIRYAHLHGKKLYLTINTLFKERELHEELYPLLLPLYEEGLDGVIVQDIGCMKYVREQFPLLPLHASTQCTITDSYGAEFFREMGCERVVPARELSLSELRKIHEDTGMELECFIHGALCYSYSGQCLMSSMIGGRSGNRGRCAQPCRMLYECQGKKQYLLSLKDLNTLKILPDILDAGVYSLKIEGRMRKTEYAAGVTAIYRKYLDLWLSDAPYRVDPADEKKLFDLFNRKGFTDGYYKRHNGKEMLTLSEADFREENEALMSFIRENFMNRSHSSAITAYYVFSEGAHYYMHLECELPDGSFSADVVSDDIADRASGRPAEPEAVEKQLRKLGGTPFYMEHVSGELEPGLFLPVSSLNAFRRKAIAALEEAICAHYRRKRKEFSSESGNLKSEHAPTRTGQPLLTVLVRTREQFQAAVTSADLLYVESTVSDASSYREFTKCGKPVYLAFPQVFRAQAEAWFRMHLDEIREAGFSGFLVRSTSELLFLRAHELPGEIITDHNLYAFNSDAKNVLLSKADRITVPLELREAEIRETGYAGQEFTVYGRAPMMVTANCVNRTASSCDHQSKTLYLRDRLGNQFPVHCDCRYCMNTIYNAVPLSLLPEWERVLKLNPGAVRLEFSVENASETKAVISAFSGKASGKLMGNTTRGHFKRGVE